MCTTTTATLLPYGLKASVHSPYIPFNGGMSQMALDIQRSQLFDYTSRLQYGIRAYTTPMGFSSGNYHGHLPDPYLHPYFYKDPRTRFIHEEPKPNHSYIGLIAMAILSNRDKKLVLSDIYQWILDNYPYFRARGPGWRNSIRHNLSLNDCFIKSGRSANGKGHYWAIHPANIEDFQKGDFRRRRAQRRVRKHMGLSVPDDDDSPSPSPPITTSMAWPENSQGSEKNGDERVPCESVPQSPRTSEGSDESEIVHDSHVHSSPSTTVTVKRRLFDMESLLAPDYKRKSESSIQEICVNCSEVEDKDKITTENKSPNSFDTGPVDVDEMFKSTGSEKKCEDHIDERVSDADASDKDFNGEIISPSSEKTIDSSNIPSTRCSAFHALAQSSLGSMPGYLSSFHIMALNGQRSPLFPIPSMTSEAAARWHQTMAQWIFRPEVKENKLS
ncbi:hypothetical protein CHS0354_028564 [Potamilus streckersoni]|uniref:Fork-head domain-containing protein n=1 Tax=Potamilus streckersoni TaxID=2493646 RepID=A0AAE0SPA4_9BIVA|nr:hypothetical protein CHS0354_028564 [Potamilus streckersoni]